MTAGYTPRFYAPVIAPPPAIDPAPPYPFTDSATNYAAMTAAHAIVVSAVGDAALAIALSGGANTRLLAMTGGCISYIPRLGNYTLPNGNRLPIDDNVVGSAAGTLVIQVWAADQLELALVAGKAVRNVSYIAYENADPTTVESAFAPLVLVAEDIEIEGNSGMDPATATRAAMEAAFLTRFMAGEVSLFVRGGTVIGSAASNPSGSGAQEITLLFFDEGGCPDSAAPFLRMLPALGGAQWQDHPLIGALPPSVVDTPPYKSGFVEYDGPAFTYEGETYFTTGIAYYPAQADGENVPFAADLSSAPIVFIAHGNHGAYRNPVEQNSERTASISAKPVTLYSGPSGFHQIPDGRWVPNGWVEQPSGQWAPSDREEISAATHITKPVGWDEIRSDKGYIYLQDALARQGIISVSINCNLASWFSGPVNIQLRAEMILSSINYFLVDLSVSSPVFGGRVDFSKVGLFGHSRGGEAVIAVAERPNAGFMIRSVLSLAPTDNRATTRTPTGYSFLAVLPSADSDVRANSGAVFYDRATAIPFKSQMYVHATNHNFFNREWTQPDNDNELLPVISRDEHERLLVAYGLPFFRLTLSGDTPSAVFVTGTARPAGAATCAVHLSFACENQVIKKIDDFEGGIATGVPTQISALIDKYVQVPGNHLPNDSYYGETSALIVSSGNVHGTYRYSFTAQPLSAYDVCLRAAEHYDRNAAFPQSATGFQIGLEDMGGVTAWIDSDRLGGLPRPYLRKVHDLYEFGVDVTKTMLETFRFPTSMFVDVESNLDLANIVAIVLSFDRDDQRVFLFDDIAIVDPGKAIQ